LPRWARLGRGGSDGGGRSRQQGAYGAATTMAVALVSTSLVVWHWGPIVEALGGPADGASSVAAFYQPLIRELDGLSGGKPVRVEVPPTQDHWESAYVAPAFSLARGWERQLDVAYDGIFYQSGTLEASTYRSWLLANGVSYVALPNAPLDYSATAEAALLRSGAVPRLQLLWRTASWRLWRVWGSPGLASGWATVIALRPKTVVIHFSRPGVSVVKLRWTPYWSLSGPHPQACIVRAPGGWTEVRTAYPGQVQLRVSVFGADHGNCKSAGEVGGDRS
jgi:hypothetical protein